MKRWTTNWIKNRLRPWLLDRLKAVPIEAHGELAAQLRTAQGRIAGLQQDVAEAEDCMVARADKYRAEQKLFENDPAAFERALNVPATWTKAEAEPDDFLDAHLLRMSASISAGQTVVLAPYDLQVMDATAMARLWTTQIAEAIRRRLFGQTLREIAKLKGAQDGGSPSENPL